MSKDNMITNRQYSALDRATVQIAVCKTAFSDGSFLYRRGNHTTKTTNGTELTRRAPKAARLMASLAAALLALLACSTPQQPSSTSQQSSSDRATPAPYVTPLASDQDWQLTRSTSAFDDSRTIILSTESKDTISGWPSRTTKPILILRCKEGKTDAYIQTGMTGKLAFGQLGEAAGTDVRMRYDRGDIYEYRMSASTNQEAYFFREPIPEIKFMLKHERVLVEFCPFNSSPQEFSFNLKNLSNVISELRAACHW